MLMGVPSLTALSLYVSQPEPIFEKVNFFMGKAFAEVMVPVILHLPSMQLSVSTSGLLKVMYPSSSPLAEDSLSLGTVPLLVPPLGLLPLSLLQAAMTKVRAKPKHKGNANKESFVFIITSG